MIWEDLGSMRWMMLLSALFILALTVWSTGKLIGRPAKADPRTKVFVDGILFWGGFAAVSGLLGSLFGVIETLQRIEAAGQVTPTLVARGYKVGLLSSSSGLIILGLAGLSWFSLQLRWRLLEAAGRV